MEKQDYVGPQIEVVEVEVERGFAGSNSQKGDIESAIKNVKRKYAGNSEMQSKGVKACIELIKRDYGDSVITTRAEYRNYNVVITVFPSGGKVYSYWELYNDFSFFANGLERMDTNYKNSILLFSSSSSFNRSIVPAILNK